jgi:hypothetical protein
MLGSANSLEASTLTDADAILSASYASLYAALWVIVPDAIALQNAICLPVSLFAMFTYSDT